MALGFATWVAFNRKHRVVKISQPIFLHLICFGVLVLSCAIFPLGIDDSIADEQGCNAACASIPVSNRAMSCFTQFALSVILSSNFLAVQWLVSTGFTLVFSALFSKLWRINRVFQAAKSMKRVVVTEKDVLKPFAVLMTLNFVILLSWTLVDPMVYDRVYTDELTSYGRCVAEGKQWKGFMSALAILNFFALVIVNVQAYKARGINDELSESKYIGLATLSMLQIFIVGVPLLVIVYNDPSAYFFVWCGIIFIICTTILLLIFVPKVVRWMSPEKKGGMLTSKWTSSQGSAAAASTALDGVASTVSDVENKGGSSLPEKAPRSNKRVSFSDKESELIYRKKMDELKDLILKEHNIDVTSIILKLQDAEGIISEGTPAPAEALM